ncbi:MAG: nucleoside deaminase [Candidatus Diapherotrites archaeon]|nr:nucleoside deaminase [Candidatus Diapherotrites archaeon]
MDYMKSATKEAYKGMRKGQGGPFGAIIIRKGKIISSAHNMVIKTNDPTAHAEIVAIRKATKKLKRFNLSDCEIYSTCEPCLMCFGAIEWAKIKKLYYGCTRKEAKMIGFDDEEIYADLKNAPKTKRLKEVRISSEETLGPFLEWVKKRNKKKY